jgi:hypothetical protein
MKTFWASSGEGTSLWRAVKSARALLLPIPDTLQNGLWPSSTFGHAVKDQFCDESTMREKYAEDIPFIGRKCDRPTPTFQVGHDVFVKYFLAVHPGDGDLRLFRVALAVINPNHDLAQANVIHL